MQLIVSRKGSCLQIAPQDGRQTFADLLAILMEPGNTEQQSLAAGNGAARARSTSMTARLQCDAAAPDLMSFEAKLAMWLLIIRCLTLLPPPTR